MFLYRCKTFKVLMFFVVMVAAGTGLCTKALANDYILEDGHQVAIPLTYIADRVIFNPGSIDGDSGRMKDPRDIFLHEDHIYVADTGNNRILKLSKDGSLEDIFYGPEEDPLFRPEGVFVHERGSIFIADTGNRRIVHLSAEGEFIEQFTKPDSEMLEEYFTFEPTKVIVTPTGYIYTIKYPSIMIIDAYNRFRGFFGQIDIGFDLKDVIMRLVASEEQKRFIRDRLTSNYLNITLGGDGLIYATSRASVEGEIKKLNAIGKNLFVLEGDRSSFGEITYDTEEEAVYPIFEDLAVDDRGMITAVEKISGKLYQYDQEGNLLTVFGGKGNTVGLFRQPVSLETDEEGNIYVLDSETRGITIFKPTLFIRSVHEAIALYSTGEYDRSLEVWNEVLKIDEDYPLAFYGIAKTYFKNLEFSKCMDFFRHIKDKDGYSKAFTKFRHDIFREYFFFVILGGMILVFIILMILKAVKKTGDKAVYEFSEAGPQRVKTSNVIRLSFGILLNPVETLRIIKDYRDRISYLPGIMILAMVMVTRIFYIYTVHFPLADIEAENANILLEMIKYMLPLLTWVIISYAVTSIVSGESKLKEIFTASAFSMIPYILINIPLAILSNIMSGSEKGLYVFISGVSLIWVFSLLFISVRELNSYTLGKTVWTTALILITILLAWGVVLLTFIVVAQLYLFLSGIVMEIRMRLL